MKKTPLILFMVFVLALALLSGCAAQEEKKPEGASATGAILNETSRGHQDVFSIQVVKDNDPVGIDFRGTLETGSVAVHLVDSQQNPIFEQSVSNQVFKVNEVVRPPAGDYILQVAWQDAVKGTYSLQWQAGEIVQPHITPMVLLPGVGMALGALGFIGFGVRKGGWKYLLWGALFWVITVSLKFSWAMLENSPVYRAISEAFPGTTGLLLASLYIGALTGLTEVLLTWLALRFTRLGKADWKNALTFGVGFGAVEALLMGIGSLVGMITVLNMPDQIPVEALRSVAQANNVLYGIAPIFERFFTIWVHVFCCVLLFYAVTRRQVRWFWVSFAFKSLLDSVAGYAQLSGQLESLGFLWMIEAIVILFGVVGWWGTRRVEVNYPAAPLPTAQAQASEI